MIRRMFLLVLVLSTWIFEVEVEAQKIDPNSPNCSPDGIVNGSTLISRRDETCGAVKNITTIKVCENGQWKEICDGNFTQEDAQVICRGLGHSAIRATAGYLSQGVGSSTASYYPECNGKESNISDCRHVVHLSECNSAKIYVTCFEDDPVPGPLCNNVSAEPTSASPTTQLPTATSVASPPHTTTGTDSTTDSSNPDTNNVGAPRSGEQSPFSTTILAAIVVPVGILLLLIFVALPIVVVLVCKRSSHRKQNFNDQVSPDSPVKVHNNQTERYKDLETGTYSELNNSTVVQHQVPVYDTVKNKSRDLSEVSASDSNEDMDNHTYSALDPDAIYTQIPPHLGLGPGNSKTLPVGMKDVSPSELYQKLDRTMSLPRTTGPSSSGSPGYMLTHAVNRTALALASGNISETDLASPRSDASIKYPSPHGSPKQHHSSSQSSTSKEELSSIRNPMNAQMENYYHVLDQGAPTVVAAAASGIATTANSDIDSQVSTDAVCNQQILDNRRQPHCHSSPRRQRQRAGAAGPGPGDMMVAAEGGDQQHFYATLEPSVRAQLTPPSRHDTRQRSQSQSTTLNNRSPPQQRQRMQSSGSNGEVRVNYSGQRVVNNFSPTSLQPPNVAAAATAAEVTNTLV